MLALPWTEDLLTRSIEDSLYYGRHMTFCRKRDDQLALVNPLFLISQLCFCNKNVLENITE